MIMQKIASAYILSFLLAVGTPLLIQAQLLGPEPAPKDWFLRDPEHCKV
jgi:hypothetical protein